MAGETYGGFYPDSVRIECDETRLRVDAAFPPRAGPQAVLFLDLFDNEEKKIGEDAPESEGANLPKITSVMIRDFDEYTRASKEKRIAAERRAGDWVYWAVADLRCVRMTNGSAMYELTERFKAKRKSPNQSAPH